MVVAQIRGQQFKTDSNQKRLNIGPPWVPTGYPVRTEAARQALASSRAVGQRRLPPRPMYPRGVDLRLDLLRGPFFLCWHDNTSANRTGVPKPSRCPLCDDERTAAALGLREGLTCGGTIAW